MRPRQILLLVLAIGSCAFMSFLFSSTGRAKVICNQKKCSVSPPSKEESGGGDEGMMFEGSVNHLIVSTIR